MGITASTLQLVRSLRDGRGRRHLERLMSDRRRMLRELEEGLQGSAFRERLAALGAAVAESDRTVEELSRSHPAA
jgi:hypothetical protein